MDSGEITGLIGYRAGKISKPQKAYFERPWTSSYGVLEHWSNLQYEREKRQEWGRLYRFIIGYNHNGDSKTVSRP